MKTLLALDEVNSKILEGKLLLLAGDESVIKLLHKGNWIGGTIPYFMTQDGGITSKDKIYVDELSDKSIKSIEIYSVKDLPTIPKNYPAHGISFIIMPAFSKVHEVFAKDVITYDGIFNCPLVGWVAGSHLKDVSTNKPKVFNGITGEVFEDKCVVMNVELPDDTYAKVDIINIFEEQADSDIITFPSDGNVVTDCFVNGMETNFADYLVTKKYDTKLPFIGDFMDAKLNVSIRKLKHERHEVTLYAPVFNGIEYKLAKPIENYAEAFNNKLKDLNINQLAFSCNCILNFIYGNLEGKKTGNISGPVTFGEIAYMLLNQTLVYCTFKNK